MNVQGMGTNRGISLVELMLSLAISAVVVLALFTMYALFSKGYRESRDSWYCMQSLRSSVLQLDADLKQCACLLPQDLRVACLSGMLFIAGAPATSSYGGIALHPRLQPPYYSVVQLCRGSAVTLDSIDIDGDAVPDYWADLGVITDSGPGVISHGYTRGRSPLTLSSPLTLQSGDRLVPSVWYELRKDGLYRNAQLLAEAVKAFDVRVSGREVLVHLLAGHNGEQKDISYAYHLQ